MAKQVPTGGIFVAAAIVTLFVLVPALALQRRERTRSREPEFERGRAR